MNDAGRAGAVCPLYHEAAELIGRRWTGAVVRALADGAIRFGEVTAAVPGLSDRMLSERLKELEAEGIVSRIVVPDYPVRIEYRLTAKGRDLGAVMDAIAQWAHRWLAPEEPPADARAAVVTA
jgi:DNA-binding HxlR family transcriptional regulator